MRLVLENAHCIPKNNLPLQNDWDWEFPHLPVSMDNQLGAFPRITISLVASSVKRTPANTCTILAGSLTLTGYRLVSSTLKEIDDTEVIGLRASPFL